MEKIVKPLIERPAWVAIAVFLICGMRELWLPGLYFDAVNPDYLAAHVMHPQLDNPRFLLPGSAHHIFLAGAFYHGVQNFYVAWLVLSLLGTSVVTIRLAQMLFGCLIVGASTTLVRRLTGSNRWAWVCGLGLATDIAFIASFRNQNYIVLGGFAWLCVSLLMLIPRDGTELGPRRVFLSGMFSGLAAYGYFVLMFFYPAVIGLMLVRVKARGRSVVTWGAGLVVGMLPYILGYTEMYRALGSFERWKTFVIRGFTGLHPMTAHSDLLERTRAVLDFAKYALSNTEGAMMAFGQPLPSYWGHAKPYLFTLVIMGMLGLSTYRWTRRRQHDARVLDLVWLPISFTAVAAAVFGARLGAHHFSVMIPLFYMLIAVFLSEAVRRRDTSTPLGRWFPVALGVVVLVLNLCQQQPYLNELDRTGGVGRSSSAMTTMALETTENAQHSIYVFPDWGFFASFALLTENRVPYLIDNSLVSIQNAIKRYPDRKQVRLAFWDKNEENKYRSTLSAAGLKGITERAFRQRDGQVAFYMLSAHVPDNPPVRAMH